MNRELPSKGMMFFIWIFVAIISVVCYQVLQKGISVNVNPAISLIITYAVALVLSCILYLIIPSSGSLLVAIKKANYTSYLLGAAVVGIEVGFLLIYRSGWKIGLAAPFTSSITNILLVSIGLIVFKEHITGLKLLGLLFCVVGIVLISIKS